jgi:hypothetical protein
LNLTLVMIPLVLIIRAAKSPAGGKAEPVAMD